MIISNDFPAGFDGARQQGCKSYTGCELLKEAVLRNNRLQQEYDTVLKIMDLLLSTIELWAKMNGSIPLGSQSKEDIEKEFANGKDKIRTLFNDLIKTGEPAFLDRLFRVLNLPEDFQHLI